MRNFLTLLLLLSAGLHAAPKAIGPYLNGVFPTTTPGPTGGWAVADAFPNLTFVDPVRMVKDPKSAAHVYIVCRNGDVWRIPFSAAATNSQKVRVLDLRANTWGYWDAGMMSIAFHPEFGVPGSPNRGYVYAYYQYVPQQPVPSSTNSPSYMRLSRFTVPDGGTVFDPSSELVMIQQYDRHNWHNGGQMFFGPEGFLHVVIGDEGASNDSYGVTQKINSRLFSGILRIDVDRDPSRSHPIRRQPAQISMPSGWQPSFTQGYFIPNDNPWQDPGGGVLEEFWTIGTRSPHSMHFDDESGEIWIADVGQGTREEITIATKGGNHQWPYKEGFANGPKAKPANLIGIDVPPIYDYPRSMGGCVIGGIVYRGNLHSGALNGKYLFGDHNTRALYALTREPGQAVRVDYLTTVPRGGGNKRGLGGICEGPDGEAYFMELGDTGTNTGKIYRLVRNGTPVADPPRWLSQTGAFTNLTSLTPRAGLLPYDVNSPLWSDGSGKRRWLAVPNDGSHNTAAERVTYREQGAWDFPAGTVLVKHFEMSTDERDPTIVKPLETRFFVHGSNGDYYGVTYRWNEQGTDAELLTGGASRDLEITAADGSTRNQRWDFPSRSDCRTCHSTGADNVLGLRSHQMSASQLEAWQLLGLFGVSFGGRDPHTLPRAVDPHDPHASLDHRVKSYLDANCSHCHHPDGVTANFDATFQTPLSSQSLIDGLINRPFIHPDERVIAPADLAKSLLHTRVAAVGGGQMPPLGKNVVDEKAVALIEDWILSLNPATFAPVAGSNSPPVAANDSLSATHANQSALNVLPNDSDANGPPGIHGLAIVEPPQHGSVRISGAQKRLIYTHDGSAARADSFRYTLTDPQGATSGVATVFLSIPFDLAAWAAVTPGAGGGPDSNADGDLFPDLLEFALGGQPDSGASPSDAAVWLEPSTSGVDLVVRRPAGLAGIHYEAETSPDLEHWTLAPDPLVEDAGNDQELLRFRGLESQPGLSADAGFVRLRVRQTSGGAGHAVLPHAWQATTFGPGSHSFGLPFREPPRFSSAVISTSGSTLAVHGTPAVGGDFKGFVEVTTGPHAGRRFDVESTAPGEISVDPTDTPPDLAGSHIIVSPHHLLEGVFDKYRFEGSTNPSAADQVQFYSNSGTGAGRFDLFYLLDARPGNPTHQWRAFLPGGGSQDSRPILPSEGMIVKRPPGAAPIRLLHHGQVRANPFVMPLQPGINLLASPHPIATSPRQWGMADPAAGFTPSTNLNAADQFQLFQAGVFRVFYLLDHPTQPDPWRETVPGSPNHTDSKLFSPSSALFIRRQQAAPFHTVDPVWNP